MMKKVLKSLLGVACVLFVAAAAAGNAEAAVQVNVSVGSPVVQPHLPPPPVVKPCPAQPPVCHECHPEPHARCHHPQPRCCAPKPPRKACHGHQAPVHRHPAPRHGYR